jgi:hypothetical protein
VSTGLRRTALAGAPLRVQAAAPCAKASRGALCVTAAAADAYASSQLDPVEKCVV